jgi:predicted nucleotide-binding protein (sugar kinase/HSP70/actin superfamily)
MTQTGGQCRATNYIMLIKKALLAAGYNNIPVISIAFSDGLNNQQEFVLDWKPLINTAMYAILFAEAISKMYYSAVAHENNQSKIKNEKLRIDENVNVNENCNFGFVSTSSCSDKCMPTQAQRYIKGNKKIKYVPEKIKYWYNKLHY